MLDGGRDRPHAWERWLPTWHALFAASLAVTNLAAILEIGWGSTAWAALAVSAVLAAWYWYFFVRVRPWDSPLWQMAIYVAGLLLAWTVLASLSQTFFYLQATLFPQFFFALPLRFAAVASFVLAALAIVIGAVRSSDGVVAADAVGTLAVVGLYVVLSAWIAAIIDQSSERGRLIEELEAAREELAAAEHQAGVLEERARLSREIHDTLAQGFTSIVMHLEAADALLGNDVAGARQHVRDAARTGRDSLAESRRFLAALRPEALESSSLLETLARVVRQWSEETGIRATFTIVGTRQEVAPEAEVTLLRALQESLANARKHSRATDLTVTVSYVGDRVSLDIHDDGIGFDTSTPAVGYGLLGMRERAERLGGELAVESEPGRGTTVAIALPIASRRAEAATPSEKVEVL